MITLAILAVATAVLTVVALPILYRTENFSGRKYWALKTYRWNDKDKTSFGPGPKYCFESWYIARAVMLYFEIKAVFTGCMRSYIAYIPLYSIDTELGIDYRDCGPWRSYRFETSGDTLAELIDNGTIEEVDQDGGTLDCYSLQDSCGEVERACKSIIYRKLTGRVAA